MQNRAALDPGHQKPGAQMQSAAMRAAGPWRRARAMALALCLVSGGAAAAVHEVRVTEHSFVPAQLTIEQGDTVRWRNESTLSHNVVADSGRFSSGRSSSASWTYEYTFTLSGDNPYHCALHGGPGGQGMAGNVVVKDAPGASFVINEGIAGSWYNPATDGQGIFMEASDTHGLVTLAWFTWTSPAVGNYDWLTGVGPFQGKVATLALNRSSGGRFNDGSAAVTTVRAGSAVLTFHDCSNATLEFEMTLPPRTGRIDLQRIFPPNQSCVGANSHHAATDLD
jgi:plastocyanin